MYWVRRILHGVAEVVRFCGFLVYCCTIWPIKLRRLARRIKEHGEGADLHAAELFQLRLATVNLEGANLSSTQISHTNLSQANLGGANLSSAHISGTNLSQANLSGANLSRAFIYHSSMTGASLCHADLTRAFFSTVDLSLADLTEADLTKAKLQLPVPLPLPAGIELPEGYESGTNLSGARLTGATLIGADLTGAILTGAILDGVVVDPRTHWPEGFEPREHGIEVPPMPTEWRLFQEDTLIGTLQEGTPDLPWFRYRFCPLPPFSLVGHVFEEETRRVDEVKETTERRRRRFEERGRRSDREDSDDDRDAWRAWESAHQAINDLKLRLVAADGTVLDRFEFFRIRGEQASFRY